MKKLILLLFTIVSFTSFSQQKQIENDWKTDINKAIQISQSTEKPLMLFFTGSDWCGWCKRLRKEVFLTEKFKTWATKNVVLVWIDFPRKTTLPEATKKQNRELGQIFGVRGYPSVWFVNPEKVDAEKVNFNKLGKTGYVAGGPAAWIVEANKILKTK
jgi:thioredoxin-related protein